MQEITIRDRVLNAIKSVYDPEIPVDVYELGLIYEINIYQPIEEVKQYNVHILMTLTSPNCPSAEEIPGEVDMKIKALPEVRDVAVELTFDPPYTQEMMSEAARLQLGFM